MSVKLNGSNEAVAWGETVVGMDIPDPPTDQMGDGDVAVWDASTKSWSIQNRGSA